MEITRRALLGMAAAAVGGLGGTGKGRASTPQEGEVFGCLVDLTACVGCRKCEQACAEVNHQPTTPGEFEDKTVFDRYRRPGATSFTVVNRYHPGVDAWGRTLTRYVKIQCMHCNRPACASACIVGALQKQPNGAVTYDESKCIGCRYCMVACPFEIPAYEYFDPLTPRVRKCTFCFERISRGQAPACASVCPVQAITFGPREKLLRIARQRIKDNPGRYIPHIYGEKEMGGTSWMYIAGEDFTRLGFQRLPSTPAPALTEAIQAGLFSYLWAPAALFAVLGLVMATVGKKGGKEEEDDE